MKIIRIGRSEPFILYVYVSYKIAPSLKRILKKEGFIVRSKDMDSDHEISVNVTPETCSKAYNIISSTI